MVSFHSGTLGGAVVPRFRGFRNQRAGSHRGVVLDAGRASGDGRELRAGWTARLLALWLECIPLLSGIALNVPTLRRIELGMIHRFRAGAPPRTSKGPRAVVGSDSDIMLLSEWIILPAAGRSAGVKRYNMPLPPHDLGCTSRVRVGLFPMAR